MNDHKRVMLNRNNFGKALEKLCDDADGFSYGESPVTTHDMVQDCKHVLLSNW